MANVRVRAIRSIKARYNGRVYDIEPGERFTLPDGADWVETGRVEVVGVVDTPPTHPPRGGKAKKSPPPGEGRGEGDGLDPEAGK